MSRIARLFFYALRSILRWTYICYEVLNQYHTINETDADKVRELAGSIAANGWVGCPILIYNGDLLTGSHRLEALRLIDREYDNDDVLNVDVAEDVTDIINANIAAREDADGWAPDIDYSNIGWLLKGSWVEQYKSEIEEW